MIIDCHTHLGRNEHIKASVNELLLSMDKAKIDKALVFANKLNNSCPNEYMLEQIAPHKDRLYGVVAFHREDAGLTGVGASKTYEFCKLLPALKEQGVVAVKFYTGYDHWYPNNTIIDMVLREVEKQNMTAIFHCGDCLNSVKTAKLKYAHPLEIDDPATDHPNLNIVIAHLGYPFVRESAEVCYKNANVYSDISGFVYGDFKEKDVKNFDKAINEFVNIAGQNKLLFGTDWPISDQTSYVKTFSDISYRSNGELRLSAESITSNTVKAFGLKEEGY